MSPIKKRNFRFFLLFMQQIIKKNCTEMEFE